MSTPVTLLEQANTRIMQYAQTFNLSREEAVDRAINGWMDDVGDIRVEEAPRVLAKHPELLRS
jgi:hypothetical protein